MTERVARSLCICWASCSFEFPFQTASRSDQTFWTIQRRAVHGRRPCHGNVTRKSHVLHYVHIRYNTVYSWLYDCKRAIINDTPCCSVFFMAPVSAAQLPNPRPGYIGLRNCDWLFVRKFARENPWLFRSKSVYTCVMLSCLLCFIESLCYLADLATMKYTRTYRVGHVKWSQLQFCW